MEAIIFRSKDTILLDNIVAKTVCPFPYLDLDDRRSGSVVRVWRNGTKIMCDIELVPDETGEPFD